MPTSWLHNEIAQPYRLPKWQVVPTRNKSDDGTCTNVNYCQIPTRCPVKMTQGSLLIAVST